VTKHPEFRHQTEYYYIRSVVSSYANVQEQSVQRNQIPQQVNTAVSYFEVVSKYRKRSDCLHRAIQGSALSFAARNCCRPYTTGVHFLGFINKLHASNSPYMLRSNYGYPDKF